MIDSYSPGWYRLKSLAEGYTPPTGGVVNQTTLSSQVDYTGLGYLAGVFPGGITTVDGVPTSALIRIHYRPEPGLPGDGDLVASAVSEPDGTWRVDGLNPALRYDVVGRKAGFNDVIMSNVQPKVD